MDTKNETKKEEQEIHACETVAGLLNTEASRLRKLKHHNAPHDLHIVECAIESLANLVQNRTQKTTTAPAFDPEKIEHAAVVPVETARRLLSYDKEEKESAIIDIIEAAGYDYDDDQRAKYKKALEVVEEEDENFEVDAGAAVSIGDDGVYVQGWRFVSKELLES